ncbi:MAG: hypothetical protein AAGC68_14235, partial [Verrucomicrobiota bacterium]
METEGAAEESQEAEEEPPPFTAEDLQTYLESGTLDEEFNTIYRGGEITLEDGRIVHRNVEILYERKESKNILETILVE